MENPTVDMNNAQSESVERFRRVFEAAYDAMVLSDADGIVVDANPAYFDLYGFTADEVIGQKFFIIFPDARQRVAMAKYREAFNAEHQSMIYESEIVRKDGAVRQLRDRDQPDVAKGPD